MKTCSKCEITKNLDDFPNNGKWKRGICKSCRNSLERGRYIEWYNKPESKKIKSQYYLENKRHIREHAAAYYSKVENKKNRNVHRLVYIKNKKLFDLNFKISVSLRTRLYIAVKKNYKAGSAVKDLGCSIQQLKIYLESKFKPGMTWNNWTRIGWHIDHIRPLADFDLANREEFLKACHYTNLQPLWAKDNLIKNDRIRSFP